LETLDQRVTPFFDAAKAYAQSAIIPFHMPGHKRGKGAPEQWLNYVGRNVLRIDSTEVDALDDLHQPVAALKEAQALAAAAHGAAHSFFLANGTSCGLQAMILATCNPGDKSIIPRNAHRSIIGGVIMAGAIPVYLQPEINTEFMLAVGVAPHVVAQALVQHPDAKALLTINPTYYGVAADLRAIVQLTHDQGLPVLVDEAHGPHLAFHPDLPLPALRAGADLTAQSYHKILSAMTQASMLHMQGEYVDLRRLKAMLRLVQTTSPSHILLASLDVARMQMATEGRAILQRTIELAAEARKALNALPGLKCLGPEHADGSGFFALDPTKITVSVKDLGISGQQAEDILCHEYGIQCELADLQNVLVMITLGDGREEIRQLIAGFKGLVAKYGVNSTRTKGRAMFADFGLPAIPRQLLSPRDALFSKVREVPFCSAAGLVSAEFVAPYPPGVPVLAPGEEITAEVIDYLTAIVAAGIRLQGPEDLTLKTIRVIDSL